MNGEPGPAPVTCNLCGTPVPPTQAPRWHRDGFDIVRCSNCGLLFRRLLPSSHELEQIYSEDYFRRSADDSSAQGYDDYLNEAEQHRTNAAVRVRKLGELSGGPGRLFDVGAAAGFFLDEARRAGWSVHGVDISPEMSAFGRDHLDLDISTGSFRELALDAGSYDAITMWDYIEHSVDPLGDLRAAHDLLRTGGVLALSTGDAGSLVARLSGERWHLLTPRHHNFFFTTRTLRRACESAGFRVLSARHPGSRYSVRYLAFKLTSMAPDSRLLRTVNRSFERSRLSRVAVPVNLWDIVTVFASRR